MAENDQNPNAPDLMGYNSVEDLVQAKRASDSEAKRLADENRRYGERLDALERQSVNQTRQVPQRGTSARDRLSEWGVPVDAIEEIVEERTNQRIQQAFEPITRGFKARNDMLAQYPDYAQFEPEVASFVNANPEVNERFQRMFQTDPMGATEYAYLKYGAQEQKKPRQRTSNAREETSHASIPTERSGEGRRQPAEDADYNELRKAVDTSGRSRDAVERFAKHRLKKAISDDFLNQ